MGKLSRTKGHSFERQVAIDVRGVFPKARRQLEYHEDDCRGVDIQGTDPFKIQCKKMKKYAPITCIEEVQCDRQLGDIPVLVTAGDHKEPVAVLYWNDFQAIMRDLMSRK